jgi:CheY-like chemotaxis protein
MTVCARLEAQIPGVTILEAAGAEEALALLARSAVDCVVTDLAMDGGGGAGLLAEMLVQASPTPVVVVSAYLYEGPVDEDAVVCLTKPVELFTLCEIVAELLRDPSRTRSRVTPAALVRVLACERRACALHIEEASGSVADLTFEHGILVEAVARRFDAKDPVCGMEGALAALEWKPARVMTVGRPAPRSSTPPLDPLSLSQLFAQHRVRKATRPI